MMKLDKGATYLAITQDGARIGWIIQQTGQRSWVATQFSGCITKATENAVIVGNSIKVMEELNKNIIIDMKVCRDTIQLRTYMFNVLKYGSFYEQ